MSEPLFRPEVMQARRGGWLGGIVLAQPIATWVLTTAAAAIALGIMLFLLLGTYTQRARAGGYLVSTRGLATVTAPVTGVVRQLQLHEGAATREGQPLALIAVPGATPVSGDTAAALERSIARHRGSLHDASDAQDQQLRAQRSGLSLQLVNAERELTQIEAEIATRQQQVTIASETLQRMDQLRAAAYVSDLQTKQQEAIVLDGRAAMQALQRQASGVRRLQAQLRQQQQEASAQRSLLSAGLTRDLAELEREHIQTQATSQYLVSAPVAGVVASQSVKVGQTVQVGQPILTLLPGDGRLEAELLVPSRSIGFVNPGDRVLLRYDAYPYQKFGHHLGRVARITRSALEPGELGALAAPPAPGEALYRVVIELERQSVTAYGKTEPLKPGMRLEADILGERRRLIEWVLEPLYSLRGRVEE